MEAIKPSPRLVNNMDVIGKYEADLEYLKNGKMIIERQMAEKGMSDEVVNKKLSKLTKTIERIDKLLEDFKNDLKDLDEDAEDSDEDK
jgi:septation ring formation regulator EzrA